jgi:hypothetical protein
VVFRNPEGDPATMRGFFRIIRFLWVTPPVNSERVYVYACEAENAPIMRERVVHISEGGMLFQ